MYCNNLIKNISLVALSLFVATSFAQEIDQEIGAVSYASVDVIPSLNISALYDDNIRNEESSPESDTIIKVAPSIRAQIDNGISGWTFDYGLEKGGYLSNSDENYLNLNFGGSFGWNIVGSHVVTIASAVNESETARTPDAPSGVDNSDELDKVKETTRSVSYAYGDRSALISYSLDASVFNRQYTTNRNVTKFEEYESKSYGGQLSLNPSQFFQVSLLADAGETRYDVNEPGTDSNDSDKDSYGVGLSWDVSTALSFNATVSFEDRDFIDPNKDDAELETYDISGKWSPLDYSGFTFGVSQTINESNREDEDFVQVDGIRIGWNSAWTDALSSNLGYSKSKSDYIGRAVPRLDDSEVIGLDIRYQFRRWVALSFGLSNTHNRSTDPAVAEFDKNTASLGATFTL